jgi:hypothetical protein
MQRTALLTAAAAACLALTAPAARADSIPWAYDWSKSTNSVAGNAGNTGGVSFTSFSGVLAGDQSVHATTIAAFISQSAKKADTYSGQAYHMVLDLTDKASSQSGEVTFTGHLFGSVSLTGGASLTNTFDSPLTQALKLGGNLYTVTIGPFIAPKVVNAGSDGRIDASVNVASAGSAPPPPPAEPAPPAPPARPAPPAPRVDSTPEPSGLVLAGLALGIGGAAWWKRRGLGGRGSARPEVA